MRCLRSAFFYFRFVISSVTFLPDILSSNSILYLSTLRLSLKISSMAAYSISLLVSRSLILFSATVISVLSLFWSYLRFIVTSFYLLSKFVSLFLSNSSSNKAYYPSIFSVKDAIADFVSSIAFFLSFSISSRLLWYLSFVIVRAIAMFEALRLLTLSDKIYFSPVRISFVCCSVNNFVSKSFIFFKAFSLSS